MGVVPRQVKVLHLVFQSLPNRVNCSQSVVILSEERKVLRVEESHRTVTWRFLDSGFAASAWNDIVLIETKPNQS
jgi:hypothetical protein